MRAKRAKFTLKMDKNSSKKPKLSGKCQKIKCDILNDFQTLWVVVANFAAKGKEKKCPPCTVNSKKAKAQKLGKIGKTSENSKATSKAEKP